MQADMKETQAVSLLGRKDVMATIAVRDVESAKKFYGGKLGLELADTSQEPEAIVYRAGNSLLLVYRSQYAGSNLATAATWNVGADVDRIVQDLKPKGVAFEHYDMPGMNRTGDVHVAGKMKAAWFKDPDGNIIALVSQ